jgi:hypothetical protein
MREADFTRQIAMFFMIQPHKPCRPDVEFGLNKRFQFNLSASAIFRIQASIIGCNSLATRQSSWDQWARISLICYDGAAVCTENLNADLMMMKPAEECM